MSDEILLLDVRDGVAVLTLNEPERRNPFSPALVEAFGRRIEELEQRCRTDVRVVVVTGAGKAFCAGASFDTMPSLAADSGLDGVLAIHAAIETIYSSFVRLDRLEVPTIAAVNGAAIGGGFGLALLCDIRIVAERAKLAANFTRLGIHSGLAITELLPRAVGYEAAADLLFTGRVMRGSEAVEMGFARKAVDFDEVLPTALDRAGPIASSAPMAVRWVKRTLRASTGRWLAPTMGAEAMSQALLMQSRDAGEGMRAMMSPDPPKFEGR
ncbi:MAG: enoyl-CoA hydratase/isomerase family protein [Myxococcota bacterium]|nr:enoyl-CoA hydratase/isomerase family protein [Myxococcota bacterium]